MIRWLLQKPFQCKILTCTMFFRKGQITVSLHIQLPSPLAQVAGQHIVELDPVPSSIDEAMQRLFQIHPQLREEMVERDGTISRLYRIFLNGRGLFEKQDLTTPLKDGDQMLIMMILAGG